MKCIVLAVLCYVSVLEATPIVVIVPGLGTIAQTIGSDVGNGVGLGVGTGVGLGVQGIETLGKGALGLGLGAARLGSGLINGIGSGLANGLGAGLGMVGLGGEKHRTLL